MTEIARRQTFDPRRPFNRAEARAAGISLDALLGPRFQKICWDTYLARDVPVTPQIRSLAALRLAPPGTHISHETGSPAVGRGGSRRADDPHHHPDGTRPVGSPRHQVALLRVLRAAEECRGTRGRGTDLVYEVVRLLVEYDGRQHSEDESQWLTDIFRREELDKMHWRLVVTWHGIYRDPLQTLERVRDALIDCGATGVRRRFKPEWRLHFPGRD